MHIYFANVVLTTLSQWRLAVLMSAMGTNNLQLYWIRFSLLLCKFGLDPLSVAVSQADTWASLDR